MRHGAAVALVSARRVLRRLDGGNHAAHRHELDPVFDKEITLEDRNKYRIQGAAIMAAVCAALTLFSCSHTQQIGDGLENVAWDCAKTVEPAILPSVESALASGDWQKQLEGLALKAGICVVSKGVSAVLDELTTKHASSDPFSLAKAQRATDWLQLHPVPAN